MPSWKSLTGPPNQTPNTPPGEDHYTCYPVTYAPGSPPFVAPSPVMVQDEFLAGALTTVTVGTPTVLCVPTEKILPSGLVFPINNQSLNYVCFKVSKTPIITRVFDQNQFGQGPVTVERTKTLCVPTTLEARRPDRSPSRVTASHTRGSLTPGPQWEVRGGGSAQSAAAPAAAPVAR